jgi:hypothetical protein
MQSLILWKPYSNILYVKKLLLAANAELLLPQPEIKNLRFSTRSAIPPCIVVGCGSFVARGE